MSQAILLSQHLSTKQLEEKYKTCDNAAESRRWHFLFLMSKGYPAPKAAEIVCLPNTTAHRVLHRYNENGPSTVADKRTFQRANRGRTPALTPELFQELVSEIQEAHTAGVFWTGAKVAKWIEERTQKRIWPQLGCNYLNRVKAALKQPNQTQEGKKASRPRPLIPKIITNQDFKQERRQQMKR